MSQAPRISVFPKCYFDELVSGQRSYVGWIHDAATLGGEGVEHYDEFFPSYEERDVAPVMDAMAATGQVTSMLCFSPNFTHPDKDERRRQVERQKRAIDLSVRIGAKYCRTLSGQKYPDLSIAEGVARAAECIRQSLDYAVSRDVVLCLENHYKVGDWLYPEFAQQEEPFLALLDALPESSHFGVQYDPSNAVVGGFDPIAFLETDQTPRRDDACVRPVPGAGHHACGDSAAGRHGRLSRQAETRRNGAGHQRLRRDLPDPAVGELQWLDLGRRRDGRTGRTRAARWSS